MSIASTTLGDAPDQVLQQALYGSVPEIKPYDALGELNKRVKSKQVSSAMQGNNAIAQAKQMAQQPPVAQQLLQQLNQGVGGLPVQETQSFASGGIVAFAEGGMPLGDREQADRAAIIRELEGMGMTTGKMLAAGYDVFTMPVRGLAMVYNQLARVPRAFGAGQTLIPDEFTGGSLTPMYDKFFPGGTKEVVSSGRGVSPGRTADMPAFTPPEPAAPPVPPQQAPGIAGGSLGGTRSIGAGGGGGSRTGIAALVPPKYTPVNPKYETMEEKTAAQLRAEDEESTKAGMQEYDARMGKFAQRAKDMQEGKGIKKPSRMERGMSAFMSGASEEYAAARRAGVRPSLGAALGAAGNAARKGDAALQEKIEAMREKGFEAEQAMEQSRMAYKAGQQELGAKYRDQATRLKSEAMGIRNKMKDNERESADKIAAHEMELYKMQMQELSKEKDRQAQLAAARERGDASKTLTPQRLAEIRRKVLVDTDKFLESHMPYMTISPKDEAKKQVMRDAEVQRRFAIALQEETGVTLPGTPGANPGAAPLTGWGKASVEK